MADLSEEELQVLYCWIDEIPLSRAKKNIARDFSDGVLTAEIVHHFLPHLVELHNYSPANSSTHKIENWRALNKKVFSKLNFSIPDDIIQSVSASKQGVIEFILTTLHTKIERYLQNKAKVSEDPHFDDGYPYDPNELTTSEIPTAYGQFNPLPPTNPQHLHRMPTVNETTTYELSRINEMHLPQPHLELPRPQPHLPFPVAPPIKLKPQNPAAPPLLQSRLRPPANYPRSTQPHNTSTLPPIHLHTSSVIEGGVAGSRDTGGQTQVAQTLTKLPNIIHGRSKTYAGRTNNRLGPQSTNVPSVALAGGKKEDSAKQQIRLAEKEQKLFETQEYIQLLQMKVTRLEHLVHIKDMKIQELYRHLAAAHSRHPLLHKH